VRVPAHPLAIELLRAVPFPVAAPSANRFGQVSPTSAEHVAEQLGERIDYILDGGPCSVGLESTVIDCTSTPPRLLRPGGLPLEDIEVLVGEVAIQRAFAGDEREPQPSPGMLPRHYAPRTPLVIVDTIESPEPGKRVGLLSFQDPAAESQLRSVRGPGARPPLSSRSSTAMGGTFHAVEVLSPKGDLREAAASFFAALRRLDALGLDAIVATPFPETGLGRALNDRLRRAAR
jgi:L-threonylcarbamoyladenylate synthase